MSTTEVNLPDGSTLSVNHPENATQLEILEYAELTYNSRLKQESVAQPLSSIDKEDAPGFAPFRGLSRGIDTVQMGYSSALEGLGKVTGLEGLEEYGAESVAEQERQLAEAEQYATRRQDVEGLGSGLTFVGETIGEQVPTLATTLAGAGAGAAIGSVFPIIGSGIGGVIGGIAANIPFFYGMNREAQKEAVEQGIKIEVSEGAAALYAIPQSALDFVADRFLLGGATSAGKFGQNYLRTGNVFTRGVKGAAAGTIAEVPTEIGQQMLERFQANQSLTSDEAITEYIDVGVAAGILGGGARATSSIVRGDIRNQDRVVEDYDPAYVDPDAESQRQVDEAEAESSIDSVVVEEKKAEQANLEEAIVPTDKAGYRIDWSDTIKDKFGNDVQRYWFHNLRGRLPAPGGGISAYDPTGVGNEYKNAVMLSPVPFGTADENVLIDISKLQGDRSAAEFFTINPKLGTIATTGQAEGYRVYGGDIPESAIVQRESAPVQVETTESRATQALEQGDRQAGVDESVNMPKLPAGLEADPQYDGYNVTWKNDIDKALFIVSDPTSISPRYDEYIAFLKQALGSEKTSQDFMAMGLDIRKTLAGLKRYGRFESDGSTISFGSFIKPNARVLREAEATIPVNEEPNQLSLWAVSEIDSVNADPETGSLEKTINNDNVIPPIISRTEGGLPPDRFFSFENPYVFKDKIIYQIQDRYVGLKRIESSINQSRAKIIEEENAQRQSEGLKPLSISEIKAEDLAPLTEEESAYLGEERSHGIIGDFVEKFSDNELQPLGEKISNLNKKFKDVDVQIVEEFLVLRHALERNKKVRLITSKNPTPNPHGAGEIVYSDGSKKRLTDDYVKSRMESDYGMKWDDEKDVWTGGNEKAQGLLDIAKDVDSITKGSLDFSVKNGLLSQKDANIVRNTFKYYVPLRGHSSIKDDISGVLNSGDGSSGGGSALTTVGKAKRLKLGRTTAADTPLGTLIQDRLKTIQDGVINDSFSQRLLELARANKNNTVWEIFGENDAKYTTSLSTSYNYVGPNPELQGNKFGNKQKFAEAIQQGNGKIIQDGIVSDPSEWIQQSTTKRESTSKIDPAAAKKRGLIGVKVDGKQVYIEIKDARLSASLLNMTPDSMNAVVRSLGKVNRFLSTINTSLNPEFVLSNFSRDIQTAVWNLIGEETMVGGKAEKQKLTKDIIKTTPRSIKIFYRGLGKAKKFNPQTGQYESRLTPQEQKDFEQYISSGSKADWFHTAPASEQLAVLQDIVDMSSDNFKGNFKKRRKAIGDFVENVNSSVENGVRFASFVKARDTFMASMTNERQKELGRKLNAQEITVIEKAAIAKASTLAKNLTINFNRRGQQGVLLNSLYLFFNAGVQGTANFMRGFVGPNPSRVKQSVGAAMVGFGALISLLNESASDEDENGESFYANIPDYEKERNMIFMKSIFDPDAEPGEYWKVPLPYGYNVFHVFGTVVHETLTGTKDIGEGTSMMTGTIIGSFVPISIGTQAVGLATAAVPSALRPVAELATNRNFWGSEIYKKNFPAGVQLPASQLSFRTTPEGYKTISEFLNLLGGGNESEPGSLLGVSTDISPDVLQHLGEFALGAAGSTGIRTMKAFGQWAKNEGVETKDIPFLRRVSGEVGIFKSQSDFYTRKIDINRKINQLEFLLNSRQRTKAYEYRNDNRAYIDMENILKDTDRSLKELNQELATARENSNRSPAAAIRYQERSAQIEDRRDAIYNRFNKAFLATKKRFEGK